ncbi:MAG: beta-galactosidase [Ferruginibacter sp.]
MPIRIEITAAILSFEKYKLIMNGNMKTGLLVLCLAIGMYGANSQSRKSYDIDAAVPAMKLYSDHLKLGGTNSKGDKIAVNNYYVSLNDKPWIPVTGEFHFSRYPNQYWDESIKKMKAGGINVIATYVFWNIHEEKEGRFRWDGDRDVRKFIELCEKNNMYVIVRIGPFCHGEIRSGGLPDWLLGRPVMIRSNDPLYLSYVEKLYNEIGKQLKGLYFKDNGPVIGIQIENEYQHSAAPWGLTYPGQPHDFTASERDISVTQQGVGIAKGNNRYASPGNDHMKILKSLAVQAGMDVPIYTATGWGNAAIIPNESIPVTSLYAYPFWTEKKDLSPFFLYKDVHKNPDYAPVRYKPEDYPAFPAELGSGIMSVYTRRPIAEHKSFDAMINRCIGSGANGVGYYMYHGGSTPRGDQYYFSDEAYGLPKISYDFQAPIGEFGQVREGFHRLKIMHFFLNDFGDVLAPMQTVLPANATSLKQENITDLRYAVRIKDNAGFLFINNFQDDTIITDKVNIRVKIKTNNGDVLIPETSVINIKAEENAVFPFNFNMNGAMLNYATAQLMMKGDEADPYFVFFRPEGVNAEFSFAKTGGTTIQKNTGIAMEENSKRILIKCTDPVAEFTLNIKGRKTKVLVVDKSLALKSYIVYINGKKCLMFSDAVVLQDGVSFTLLSDAKNNYDVSVYPKINIAPVIDNGNITNEPAAGPMATFKVSLPEVKLPIETRMLGEKKMAVKLPASLNNLDDIFLQIDYTGDTGMGFIDGELVTDEFYKGIPWQIGLKKIYPNAASKEMVFYFRPLQKGASYLADLHPSDVPDFGKANEVLTIKKVFLVPAYKVILTFKSSK